MVIPPLIPALPPSTRPRTGPAERSVGNRMGHHRRVKAPRLSGPLWGNRALPHPNRRHPLRPSGTA